MVSVAKKNSLQLCFMSGNKNLQIWLMLGLPLSDGGPYHIETSPLICRAINSFYMIETSFMNELIHFTPIPPEKITELMVF